MIAERIESRRWPLQVPQATAFQRLGSKLLVIAGGGGIVKIMEIDRWTTLALLPTPPSLLKPASRHRYDSPRNRYEACAGATAVVADGLHSIVVQYANSSLCSWDLQNPSKAVLNWEYLGHAGAITSLCSPPRPYNAEAMAQIYATVCSDGYARVWRRSTCSRNAAQVQMSIRLENTSPKLERVQSLIPPSPAVAQLSAAGQMLAVGGLTGSVSVYLLPSPTKYRLAITHDGRVTCLSWGSAHDGQCLASGGDDGRVHLHHIQGERISPLKTIEVRSEVVCMAMLDATASQPLTLAVCEQNGNVTLWCDVLARSDIRD